MRVSLYGRVLNLALLLGVFLRRKGHDVRVFVNAGADEQDRPEWECVSEREAADVPLVPVSVDLKRWLMGGQAERRFRRQLAEADVVQTVGEDVIWSAGCGAPDTVLSIGDDLDVLPFRRDSLRIRVYAALLRRAQRRCRAVCYTMTPQEDSCRQLGLPNARYLPCAIPYDTDRVGPLSRAEFVRARNRLGLPEDGFVITQPSRQEWTYPPDGAGSNHKGNDRFLRAFARFLQGPGRGAWLVAVTKGRDVTASQRLAASLGMADRIKWIPQQNKAGLRECLGASDVVADCFTYGFYPMSTLDAMSIGRPVLVYLEPKGLEKFGVKPPPVVSVQSEEEIYHALCQLAATKGRGEEIGAASREWMIQYHGWEPVIERYLALYKELLG